MHTRWKQQLAAFAFVALLVGVAIAGSSTYPKGVANGTALFNFAATGGAPAFASDFQLEGGTSHPATYLEIGVCVEAPSTFGIEITDGTTTKVVLLNSGAQLPAGAGGTFVWPIDSKDQDGDELSFNVVFGSSVNVSYCAVREIQGR